MQRIKFHEWNWLNKKRYVQMYVLCILKKKLISRNMHLFALYWSVSLFFVYINWFHQKLTFISTKLGVRFPWWKKDQNQPWLLGPHQYKLRLLGPRQVQPWLHWQLQDQPRLHRPHSCPESTIVTQTWVRTEYFNDRSWVMSWSDKNCKFPNISSVDLWGILNLREFDDRLRDYSV